MKLESKNSAPDGGEWTIKAAGLTQQGQVREDNEDAFLLSTEQGLYLVNDGMGGTTAGKAISNAVVEVLPVQLNELIQEATIYESTQMASILGKAIAMLSDELLERSSKDRSLCGAGAAVISCWLLNGIAAMVHMGDCRLYRLRSNHFEKLTDDHNIAALLLQMGHIDEKEALKHPGRHMLTRFVGMKPEAQPDMSALEVVPGDKLLLCSDGWFVGSSQR